MDQVDLWNTIIDHQNLERVCTAWELDFIENLKSWNGGNPGGYTDKQENVLHDILRKLEPNDDT